MVLRDCRQRWSECDPGLGGGLGSDRHVRWSLMFTVNIQNFETQSNAQRRVCRKYQQKVPSMPTSTIAHTVDPFACLTR